MTIAEAITKAAALLSGRGAPDARLDSELLFCHATGRDRAWLISHFRDAADDASLGRYHGFIERRALREPMQYIVGKQEFRGMDFIVNPDVLIPRPETESVVEAALKAVAGNATPTIVDLCTGSGCIAVSLAKEIPKAHIFATDVSGPALDVARENARKNGASGSIRFLEGDLFEPLEELDIRGKVDVIASNPPYVKSSDLPGLQPEVRDYEPEAALIAGPDGTEIEQAIIEISPDFLRKGGTIILEMGLGQAGALEGMIRETGAYETPAVLKDLAGIDRVIAAKKL